MTEGRNNFGLFYIHIHAYKLGYIYIFIYTVYECTEMDNSKQQVRLLKYDDFE